MVQMIEEKIILFMIEIDFFCYSIKHTQRTKTEYKKF